MIDLRDVNNLFIKKIIAWLFGKSSSEGVGGGGVRNYCVIVAGKPVT